jgi:hypothetical protein
VTPLSDAEIERRLQAILESPAFEKRGTDYFRQWVTSSFRAFFEWLEQLPPSARGLLLVLCVLVLLAIGASLYLSLESSPVARIRGRRAGNPQREAGQSADALLARARALAQSGNWREAARALQQAAFIRLSRERGLPWRPDLTDWEWVVVLGGGVPLREFTRLAEQVAFGPQPDAAGFAACERRYPQLFMAPR